MDFRSSLSGAFYDALKNFITGIDPQALAKEHKAWLAVIPFKEF